MEAEQIRSQFRRIDRSRYPEVDSYSWDDVYGHGDAMAPGGLYLAAKMAASLDLKTGDTVLDLACGRGDTSIYLVREFGARVLAVDLRISATTLGDKFRAHGCHDQIVPVQLDANRDLPFAEDWFDAIFCMQAFHSFGGSVEFVRYLLLHLREGGRLCIGGSCFSDECSPEALPDVYRQSDDWDTEYSRYHSPPWWRELFKRCELVDVLECNELEDGLVMWEDEFLYRAERASWSDGWLAKSRWLGEHILYGRDHRPRLTHFIATVEKRPGTSLTRPSAGRPAQDR